MNAARRFLRVLVLMCVAMMLSVSLAGPAAAANPHFVHAARTVAEPEFLSTADGDFIIWFADVTFTFHVAGLGANTSVTVEAGIAQASASAAAQCPSGAVVLAVGLESTAQLTSDANGMIKGTIVLRRAIAVAGVFSDFSSTCGAGVRVAYDGLTLTAAGAVTALPSFDRVYAGGEIDVSVLL